MRPTARHVLTVCVALAGLSTAAFSDEVAEARDLRAAHRLAVIQLEASRAAHGSLADERLSLRLEIDCDEYRNATQSLRAEPPVESYSWRRRYRIDRPAGRESVWTRNEFAGFVFEDSIESRHGVATRYDHRIGLHEPVADSGFERLFLLPQRTIDEALAARGTALAERTRESDGTPTVTIHWASGGFARTLVVDAASGLALRSQSLGHADPYGTTVRTVRYEGRQSADGLTVPTAVVVANRDDVLGEVSNRFLLRLEPGAGDASWTTPEGSRAATWTERPPVAVRTVAPGIHLLANLTSSTRQWSYNVLVAERSDHVLVAEAPLDEATWDSIVERVETLAPGKPIRYLVQSHHHDDHLGGIRAAISAGVRIVTSPGNVALVGRIAAAPYDLRPDRLSRLGRRPDLQPTAGGRLDLPDETNGAVVFDVGPTAHAEEMLVTYFPEARVLFQADLVNAGEFPRTELAERLADRIRALGLDVELVVGLHGEPVSGADLLDVGAAAR